MSNKMKRALSLSLALIFLTVSAAPAGVSASGSGSTSGSVYYVDAENGSDETGDGSDASPWETITRAASVMVAGDTCKIRTGTYRETVDVANSGTEGAYITFEPDDGADVTINGTDLITGSWSDAGNNIYTTSAVLSMGDWKNQLFVDGVAMNLARWPNSGTDPLNQTFAEADGGGDSQVLDSELTMPSGYWIGAALVAADKTRWTMTSGIVKVSEPGEVSARGGDMWMLGNPPGKTGEYGSPYYLVGKLAALDSANEWFWEKTTNTLYLQTPESDSPANHKVEVKARRYAFNLDGKDYIRIKGINIFGCTIDTRGSEYCEIDGIKGKYLSHNELMWEKYNDWIPSYEESGITLGGTGNVIRNSELQYAQGGLVVTSGYYNKVINNLLHDACYGPQYTAQTGIITVNGTGMLISHNTVYNSSRLAIGGWPYNCRIQYNEGYNVMMWYDDGGAVYAYATDGGGTELHHNYFHDIATNPPYSRSAGIYLDEKTSNYKVFNNVTSGGSKGSTFWGIFLNAPNKFILAYNNTTYNASAFDTQPRPSDAYGIRTVNNIVTDRYSVTKSFQVVDMNNLKEGNPSYVNPSEGNFQLNESSPAIDAGVVIPGITDGYVGDAPDIGAFEYGKPAWKVGCDLENPPEEPEFITTYLRYENLMTNGSFDNRTDNMEGWTVSDSSQAQFAYTDGSLTAARTEWLFGLKLGNDVATAEQTITGLKSNTEYELRGFGRTESNQTLRIGVKGYDGTEADSGNDVTASSWTKVELRFTTGETDTSATVYVNKLTAGGLAYADDITLMEVDHDYIPPEPEAPPVEEPKEFTDVDNQELTLNSAIGDAESWTYGTTVSGGSITFTGTEESFYSGEKYGDQMLSFNMNADGDSDVSSSIFIRSNGTTIQDGYKVTFKEDGIELRKIENGVSEDIYLTDSNGEAAGTAGPAIENNNIFLFGQDNLIKYAALNTKDGVKIVLYVNGIKVIEYDDTVDFFSTLKQPGYFAVLPGDASYLTLSETADDVDLNNTIDNPSGWSGDVSAVTNGISLNNNDLVTYQGRIYGDELISFRLNSDINDLSDEPMVGIRNDGSETENNGYFFTFKSGTIELTKTLKGQAPVTIYGTDGLAGPGIVNDSIFISEKDNLLKLGAQNTALGVRILLYVNNKKVIDYLDPIANNPITAPGHLVATKGTAALYTIKKIPTSVYLNSVLEDLESWGNGDAIEGGIKFSKSESIYTGRTFREEMITFDMQLDTANDGNWPIIAIRNDGNIWGDGYIFVIRKRGIELQKRKSGTQTNIYIGTTPEDCGILGMELPNNDTLFKYGQKNRVEFGAIDTVNGVRILLYVNGIKICDYTDKVTPVTAPGYFAVHTGGAQISLYKIEEENIFQEENIAAKGTIIAAVTEAWGQGTKDLEILRDGIKETVGSSSNAQNYDTWRSDQGVAEQYYGYTFGGTKTFHKVVFQEGRHFSDGGWFKDGTLRVQIKQGDEWIDVPAAVTPVYPVGDTLDDFGQSFETYTFTFNEVTGSGIRIYGLAGGSSSFTSIAELEVWSEVLPEPGIRLTGSNEAEVGGQYELTYGLTNAHNITSQDITINFDNNVFEPASIETLADNITISEQEEGTAPGTIRLTLAAAGEGNAINGDADVLKMIFNVKSIAAASAIIFTGVELRNGSEAVLQDANISKIVKVSKPIPEGAWMNSGDGNLWGGQHLLAEGNTGTVTTEFKITPLVASANSGMGYTSYDKEARNWSELSAILKLNTAGYFDIYNYNTAPLEYTAPNLPEEELPQYAKRYEVGKTYLVKMIMNTDAQTYSAWVTDLGDNGEPISEPFCIGENYRFRASAGGMNDVGRCYTGPGTNGSYYVTDHRIVEEPTPTPTVPTEPTPTGPDPTDPAEPTPTVPAEPTPTGPAPTEPAEPTPTVPAEPTPTGPAPTDPAEPTPTDPVELTPTGPAPTDPAGSTPTVQAPTIAPTSTPAVSFDNDTSTVSTKVTVIGNTAQVDADTLNALIGKSIKEKAKAIKIIVDAPIGAKEIEVILQRDAFKQLADSTKTDVKIDAGIAAVTFDDKAIDSINSAAATGDISISVKAVDKGSLTPEARAGIGDRPVYDFTLRSGDKKISEFGNGKVEVSIPYTLKPGEKKNSIVVYYIDNSGKLITVKGKYDEAAVTVQFTTKHFSSYVIGYKEVKISDIKSGTGSYDAVQFLAARGVMNVFGGKFSPSKKISKADFIMVMMKAYDIRPDSKITDNFNDAGNKYYTSYLATAKRLGFIKGVGNNKFKPDAVITKKDMLIIIDRVLKYTGEQPVTSSIKTDKKVEPKSTMTRGGVAELLYELLTR